MAWTRDRKQGGAARPPRTRTRTRAKGKKRAEGGARPSGERRVLVVDDAEGVRRYLANLLALKGFAVDTAGDGRSAIALLEGGAAPDVVLLDVMMEGLDGLETLRRIRELDRRVPVVMLSVVGKTSTIVEAMRSGATDYLTKPFEDDQLLNTLEKALEERSRQAERERQRQGPLADPQAAVWHSAAMQNIRSLIEQISDTDVTVLIQGESGVGKEIIARSIHSISTRSKRPFVKINCAALPEDLLESELFGYEQGAFTGAVGRKPGKFELADGGTIFLDEIGEMSPKLQAKLLQVLQDAEFTRLGGHREIRVDVQVVSATNQPLQKMVMHGSFREDLFFRLNVVKVDVPPLRERPEEIPILIDTFLERYSLRYGKPKRTLSAGLRSALLGYAFPGNIRELENMIKRVLVLEGEESVLVELAEKRASRYGERGALHALLAEIEESAGEIPLREVAQRMAHQAERDTIERALHRTSWNRKQAAKLLNVSYKTLLQKIRDRGLKAEA